MDSFSISFRTVLQIALFFFLACLVLWVVIPVARPFAAGLAAGMTVSLINARYLMWKIVRWADRLPRTGQVSARHKAPGLGFFTRAAMAALVVIVAHNVDYLSLLATLIGIFSTQVLMMPLIWMVTERRKQ